MDNNKRIVGMRWTPDVPEDEVPPTGAQSNVQTDDDLEYLESVSRRPEKEEQQQRDSRYFYGRPPPEAAPIDAIKQALQVKEVPDDLLATNATEYFQARLQANRASCPMCNYSGSHEDLKEHLRQHKEIREYERWYTRARDEYRRMSARQTEIREESEQPRKKIRALGFLITKSEKESKPVARQEQGLLLCRFCPAFVEDGDNEQMRQHVQSEHASELKIAEGRAYEARNK